MSDRIGLDDEQRDLQQRLDEAITDLRSARSAFEDKRLAFDAARDAYEQYWRQRGVGRIVVEEI